MMIECNVDRTMYNSKPEMGEVGKIQKRIQGNYEKISIAELADLCGKGCTHRSALISGTTGDTWISQQLIELDFDHGTTIKEQLDRCAKMSITPAFGYKTFSNMIDRNDGHGAEERFRLAFVLPSKTEDYRLKNLLHRSLLKLFPDADSVTIDPGRLFFGGRSSFIIDEDARIKPFELIMQVQSLIRATNKEHGNYARKIAEFAQTVGVNLIGNNLDVKLLDACSICQSSIAVETDSDLENPQLMESVNLTDLSPAYINNIGAGGETVNFIRISFSTTHENMLKNKGSKKNSGKSKKGSCKAPKTKIEKTKSERAKKQRRFDFVGLQANCKLFKQATNGEIWCTHNEIFGLATNLQCVEGGESKLFDIIEHDCYMDHYDSLLNTIKYVGVTDYKPMNCENFCPYAGNLDAIKGHKNNDLDDFDCNHKLNLLQMTDLKRLKVRQVSKLQVKDKDEMMEELITEVEKVKKAFGYSHLAAISWRQTKVLYQMSIRSIL